MAGETRFGIDIRNMYSTIGASAGFEKRGAHSAVYTA